MNYKKLYDNLVLNARARISNTGYTEIHHIQPRCLGGDDDPSNLVEFTLREHFIAHAVLAKMNPGNHKLLYAFNMMCTINDDQETKNNSHKFKGLKTKYRDFNRGENHPTYGRKQTDEAKALVGRANSERVHTDSCREKHRKNNTGEGNPFYGKKHTDEAKNLQREANTGENNTMYGLRGEDHPGYGYKFTEEQKARHSENTPRGEDHWMASIEKEDHPRFGTKIGEVQNKAICKANSDRPQPVVVCPHCDKSGKLGGMKVWHFDNCKQRPISV